MHPKCVPSKLQLSICGIIRNSCHCGGSHGGSLPLVVHACVPAIDRGVKCVCVCCPDHERPAGAVDSHKLRLS